MVFASNKPPCIFVVIRTSDTFVGKLFVQLIITLIASLSSTITLSSILLLIESTALINGFSNFIICEEEPYIVVKNSRLLSSNVPIVEVTVFSSPTLPTRKPCMVIKCDAPGARSPKTQSVVPEVGGGSAESNWKPEGYSNLTSVLFKVERANDLTSTENVRG